MKKTKRTVILALVSVLITAVFTACHSHKMSEVWTVDKDSHWHQCECGEVSEKSEHSFEKDICTVCGAERKTEDGTVSEIYLSNSYGDLLQSIYYDEDGNIAGEVSAEYTYDKDGNKLTDRMYENGILVTSGEYAKGSEGITYKKYESEYYGDGTKCVYEFGENGDSLGYVIYDEKGEAVESSRSEYVTDEQGNLTGEKVYENDVLVKEMKYAMGNDGEEDYYYTEAIITYYEDGSYLTEKYDEGGLAVQEILYNAYGEKEYEYELECVYNDDGSLASIEKSENGAVKQREAYEYDSDGNLTSIITYEGDSVVRESHYTTVDTYSYESKIVIHNDDGTKTVYEYDENGDLIG